MSTQAAKLTPLTMVEVAPRDGLQNEAKALDPLVRAELVERSIAAGAQRIEAVSFVRPDRVPQMAGAAEVLAAITRPDYVKLAALVLNQRGLDQALECGVDEINIAVPCTDTMSMKNQGKTVAEMVAAAIDMLRTANSAGVFTTVTIAVAFGCPFEGRVATHQVRSALCDVLEGEPDEVALADTIGVGVPDQVRALSRMMREAAPGLATRYHFHNTRNTGYANALAAVESGVHTLDSSVGGYGGCPFAPNATGNIATEDTLYLLHNSGYRSSIDPVAAAELGRWLGEHLEKPPPGLINRAGWFPPVSPTTDNPKNDNL